MSEKLIENKLYDLLTSFDQKNIYYSPSQHKTLKNIFKNASKTGNGRGIPDRIYYDKSHKVLIIFECKCLDIDCAVRDLKLYKTKMLKLKNYNIYFVAVVENMYKIFDYNFKEINKVLKPTTFNIKNINKYSNKKL